MKKEFEPTNTWHRSALILLVVGIVGSNATWWFYARNYHGDFVAEYQSTYPYLDLARNFIAQEHYLSTIQPLRTMIRAKTDAFEAEGRDVSLYLHFLNTGANISINQEKYIYPASLLKLPLALAVLKKAENDEWEIENELVLLEEDKNLESGFRGDMLGSHDVGSRFTIEFLLRKLLIDSDNTAYNIFLRNIGEKEILNVIDALGLEAMLKPDGALSAKEYSRILQSLYTASYLGRRNSQRVLSMLDESPFNEFLGQAIPEDVKFPHKYGGRLPKKIFADAGIVYVPNKPYILVVLIQGKQDGTEEEETQVAKEFMGSIAKDAYAFFSTASNSDQN